MTNVGKTCRRCGEPIPPSALAGNCPRCLAVLALSTTAGEAGRSGPNEPDAVSAPQRFFGDYEILGELARGGMGVVYRARQVSLNRLVALKMIAAGQLATVSQVQRFQLEAEAAARLDHPNIVPIYEVGEHQGRHFYSMKLFEGGSLAQHMANGERRIPKAENAPTGWTCDIRHSALVISQVARAVHYAHLRGVLHRDLKPSNILLDTHGQPHVTDFGLAKLFDDDLTLTQTAAVLGTPAYMAPEIASGRAAEATTAADIYSLGAILYEIRAGQPPFKADTVPVLLRRIVEEQPPAPSAVASQTQRAKSGRPSGPEGPGTGGARGRAHPGLRPADLDVICLKCLEKEPTRRYTSAASLADDLERWLRDEPIQARPASAAEKLARWCRRQPALAGLSLALAVAVLSGLVGTSLLLWGERQARQRASAAEQAQSQLRVQAEAEREHAKTEAARSRQLALFLQQMLDRAGPSASLGRDTTLLREILDWTASRVGRELTNQPAVAAEMHDTIGHTYYDVGDFSKAVTGLREAVRLRRQLSPGHDDLALAQSIHLLAEALAAHGDLDEAETLNRESLALRTKRLGPGDRAIADSLNNLGNVYFRRNDLTEAQRCFDEALAIYRQHNDPKTAAALNNVANMALQQNDPARAEALYREAVELSRQRDGDEHPSTALHRHNLAIALRRQGKLAEAAAAFSEALVVRASLLDELNPGLAQSLEGLAEIKRQQGQWTEAEVLYRKALAARRRQAPEDPQAWSDDAVALAEILVDHQRFDDAESLLTELLAAAGEQEPRTARLRAIRGNTRARHGQWREARQDLARALALDAANPDTRWLLAPLLLETGQQDAYAELGRNALAEFAANRNPVTAACVAQIGLLAPDPRLDVSKAHEILDRLLATEPQSGARSGWLALKALAELRSGRPRAALERAEDLLQHLAAGQWSSGRFVPILSHAVRAMAHQALGQPEEAQAALAQALTVAPAKIAAPTHGDYGPNWPEWLMLQLHLREARSSVESTLPAPAGPSVSKP